MTLRDGAIYHQKMLCAPIITQTLSNRGGYMSVVREKTASELSGKTK